MNMSEASARATAARTSASASSPRPSRAASLPRAVRRLTRHSRSFGAGPSSMRAVDADRRLEQVVADLLCDALGIVERLLGSRRVSGQHAYLGVEDRHPYR